MLNQNYAKVSAQPKFAAFKKSLKALLLFSFFNITLFSPIVAKAAIYESFTLNNGMKVIVIPNHRVPVVTHMVWYKVGAKDEPLGKSGLAHFLEHMMFKGTKTLKPGEFSSIVAHNGGNDNAFTSQDFTAYFQTIAKSKLPLLMNIESERMHGLKLLDDELRKEREVILEERRSRTENDPRALLIEQMRAALFLNHPYGRPIIGWSHEIKALANDDIREFYHKHYAPNRAILVVAGDITAAELRPLAEKTYGKIPAVKYGEEIKISEPPHISPRRLYYSDEKVQLPEQIVFYLAPSQVTDPKMANALAVLAQILGGGETSRLYQSLVIDQKIAASASAHYDDVSAGETMMSIYMMPNNDVPLSDLETAMQHEIAALIKDGVTADELKRAKTVLKADAIYARDSSKGMAFAFGEAVVVGLPPSYVESWPQQIEAVTAEQVRLAAIDLFKNEKSVTGILLPKAVNKKDKKTASAKTEPVSNNKN